MSDFQFEKGLREHQEEMSKEIQRQREIPAECSTCCYSTVGVNLCGYYPGNPKPIELRRGFPCYRYEKDVIWRKKEGQLG